MSDATTPSSAAIPAEPITLDEVKQRANAVKDLAVSESKRLAAEVTEADVTKVALVVVGAVVVVASLAYFLGSRAGRRTTLPLD